MRRIRRWTIRFTILCVAPILGAAWTAFACHEPSTTTRETNDQTEGLGLPGAPDEIEAQRSALAGGLIGSKHDFSMLEGGPRDLCLVCHTPHLVSALAPLLDKTPGSFAALRTYQAFDAELDSSTLLCLSCHDGLIASDVYSTSHATSLAQQLGSSQIGGAGLRSHPIGVRQPVGDSTYRSPDLVTADGLIKLPGGRVQCVSCHDPHNTRRHPAMLVKTNERSTLCFSCHRL